MCAGGQGRRLQPTALCLLLRLKLDFDERCTQLMEQCHRLKQISAQNVDLETLACLWYRGHLVHLTQSQESWTFSLEEDGGCS